MKSKKSVKSRKNWRNRRRRRSRRNRQPAPASNRSARPRSFCWGTVSTVMELTSALPYFAFLGLLTQYRLSLPEVVLIQLLYNLIYTSPLMVLYLIYCKRQQLFDRVYRWVKGKMERIAPLVLPLLLLAAGAALAVHAAMALVG